MNLSWRLSQPGKAGGSKSKNHIVESGVGLNTVRQKKDGNLLKKSRQR